MLIPRALKPRTGHPASTIHLDVAKTARKGHLEISVAGESPFQCLHSHDRPVILTACHHIANLHAGV